MKKSILYMASMICILIFSSPAFSLDMLIGPKAGYYIWNPYFQEMDGSGIEELDSGSGILYGGVLGAVLTDRISVSLAVLTGKQSTRWNNDNTKKEFGNEQIIADGTYYADIGRTDVDSAVSYRIMSNIKIFAGYKYQYAESKIRATFKSEVLTGPGAGEEKVQIGNIKVKTPSHGPALGAGYSRTFGTGFFFSVNLSGVFMWSKWKLDRNEWISYVPSGTSGEFDPPDGGDIGNISLDLHQVGMNLEPTIGMQVKPVIVTIGGRFQWMRSKFQDDPVAGNTKFGPDDWMNDYLYGVFVSVIYVI